MQKSRLCQARSGPTGVASVLGRVRGPGFAAFGQGPLSLGVDEEGVSN